MILALINFQLPLIQISIFLKLNAELTKQNKVLETADSVKIAGIDVKSKAVSLFMWYCVLPSLFNVTLGVFNLYLVHSGVTSPYSSWKVYLILLPILSLYPDALFWLIKLKLKLKK